MHISKKYEKYKNQRSDRSKVRSQCASGCTVCRPVMFGITENRSDLCSVAIQNISCPYTDDGIDNLFNDL